MNILIDRGLNNRFTNILATYKLAAKQFSLQIGYTLRNGIHLGIVDSIDNSNIDQLTTSLASRINNSFCIREEEIHIEIVQDESYTYADIDEVIAVNMDTDRQNSTTNSNTINNKSDELEGEFEGSIEEEFKNDIDEVLYECLPLSVKTIINNKFYQKYKDDFIHYFKVLGITIKPIIRVYNSVITLDDERKIKDIIRINKRSNFKRESFEVKDYIYKKSQFYRILKRTIKPIIKIETSVKEVKKHINKIKSSDITIYFDKNDKKIDNLFKSTMIKLHKKINSDIIYSGIGAEVIDRQKYVLQTFIENNFL